MPTTGHPPTFAGLQTSSRDVDTTDCPDGALVISRPARASIERLGTTAWVVLEVLALDAVADDGALVSRTSARSIAEAVSVSKDTAAGALRRLVDAGIVERRRQHRTGGRFGTGGYRLSLPAGLAVTSPAPDDLLPAPTPPPAPVEPPPRRTRPPRPRRHDQLTLLADPQEPQP